MKTEEELAWQWRTRRLWLVVAVFYTLWPLAPLAGGDLTAWLGGPHTWGGRAAYWFGAGFFCVLYLIRPTRRSMALAAAIALSIAETALILNRLNIIRDQAARASNLGLIGIGSLAAFCWIWHFRSHPPVKQ